MSTKAFNAPMWARMGAVLKWTLLSASLTLGAGGCMAPVDEPMEPPAPTLEQAEPQGDEDAPRQALAPVNDDWSAPLSEDPHAYDSYLAATTPAGIKSALIAPSCNPNDLRLTSWPLSGTNGRTWMVNNYVDLDPVSYTHLTLPTKA